MVDENRDAMDEALGHDLLRDNVDNERQPRIWPRLFSS